MRYVARWQIICLMLQSERKTPRYEASDIAHASLAGRNFPDGLSKWKTGTAILHPAFRDSTWFFSFFSISPSTWAAVQPWTEIPIELESRAAMTQRPGKQKNNWVAKRNGERNVEIECRALLALIRYNYARHRFPQGIVTTVFEWQCCVLRLPTGKRDGKCVVRNKCWKLWGRRIPRGNSEESFRVLI